MKDCNCIFCKIANGEIPSATLYEDPDFRVILDLNPASKGHALVLPKEHYANVFELPEDLAGKAFVVAKRLLQGCRKASARSVLTSSRITGSRQDRRFFIFTST